MNDTKDQDQAASPATSRSTDLLGDFRPLLRNTTGNTYEAYMRLPGVGDVTTSGNGWQEAKIRLWIIKEKLNLCDQFAQAVRENSCGHKPWGESGKCEACVALKQWDDMSRTLSPNVEVTGLGRNRSNDER